MGGISIFEVEVGGIGFCDGVEELFVEKILHGLIPSWVTFISVVIFISALFSDPILLFIEQKFHDRWGDHTPKNGCENHQTVNYGLDNFSKNGSKKVKFLVIILRVLLAIF